MKTDVKIEGGKVQLTRVFAAPRAMVFDYWANGEKMAKWSTCAEAVRCEVQMDFRVGGKCVHTMEIRNVGEFTLVGTYEEIVVPEKIVYSADFGPAMKVVSKVTIEFFDEGKSTKVVLTHDGLPNEFFGQNVAKGTTESFEFLDRELASQNVAQTASK
jgi:uncharacterized protein YndB with AHSA1/START domain